MQEQWPCWANGRDWMPDWYPFKTVDESLSHYNGSGILALSPSSPSLLPWLRLGSLLLGKLSSIVCIADVLISLNQYIPKRSHQRRTCSTDLWSLRVLAGLISYLCVSSWARFNVKESSPLPLSDVWPTASSPTSGGQYHWVAELAPVRHATILSWIAGRSSGLATERLKLR